MRGEGVSAQLYYVTSWCVEVRLMEEKVELVVDLRKENRMDPQRKMVSLKVKRNVDLTVGTVADWRADYVDVVHLIAE